MLSHGTDYILSLQQKNVKAHYHLVSERLPVIDEKRRHYGVRCGFPIVASLMILPYPRSLPRPSARFRNWLGYQSFRGFPHFDSVAWWIRLAAALSRTTVRRDGLLLEAKPLFTWNEQMACVHFWWCPSVNSFKFQPCDHTPPRTQKLAISLKVRNYESPSPSRHRLWLRLRRYLIVFDPLTFVLDQWKHPWQMPSQKLVFHKSSNFTSDN